MMVTHNGFCGSLTASLSLWVYSALPAVRPCVDAVAASHCWQLTNVRTEHGMAASKHLESMVAAWMGGIWAHRNSSWCSSDVGIRVRNLGYFWNQWRPRALWASLCSRSSSLASRSRSSTCHRSSLINMRLGTTPEVFRGVPSSWACTLESWDHFIQLKRGMADTADSPGKLKKQELFFIWIVKPWIPHSTILTLLNVLEYLLLQTKSQSHSCSDNWQDNITPWE